MRTKTPNYSRANSSVNDGRKPTILGLVLSASSPTQLTENNLEKTLNTFSLSYSKNRRNFQVADGECSIQITNVLGN